MARELWAIFIYMRSNPASNCRFYI